MSDVATVLSSRRLPSIETAGIISSVLEVARAEPTCDLCRDAPGAAEELTQEQMTERFGPNYAFVPGAESWTDYVPKGTDALRSIPSVHPGRTVIGVIESAVVRASFIAFGRMPAPAAKVIMTGHGSITEWSCLVEDDVRTVESWRLERYNDIR